MKRLVRVSALFSALLLVGSTTASADDNKPVLVSKGDPFASCIGVGGNGSARSYRSAEIEPWIAVNPKNTANVIGAWQQDRWSDGGAKGQVAGWSFDGGRTWGQTPQPFTLCAQPFYRTKVLQYERTSDPWVSVGPDGTVYSVSLPFDGDFIRSGLGTAVSRDGGRTWVDQLDIDPLVARPDTFNPSDDKQSVTADPELSGVAYVVFDQLRDIFPPCPPAAHAAVQRAHPAPHRATRAASLSTSPAPCPNFVFTGPTLFSKTRNGGKTWSQPRVIVPTGVNEQTIGNIILVDPAKETLYDFFDFIEADGSNNIEMVFSKDGGEHWSARQYVQRLFTTAEKRPNGCACGVVYPGDESKPLRTGDIIPAAAIDPNTGQLYVIWQDGRPNSFQNDMLLASTSTAGGLTGTWSAPKLVNPLTDNAAFTASIAVNGSGQVGVTYYDFTPPLTSPDILLTDVWFTQTNGPGLDFGPRTLIGGPFNMLAAPIARGFFVGDYEGLAAQVANRHGDRTQNAQGDSEDRFIALFVMTNCADNSCRAQFSRDGTPVGPDSTDAFSAAPGQGNFGP
jgi:hypothetical protein